MTMKRNYSFCRNGTRRIDFVSLLAPHGNVERNWRRFSVTFASISRCQLLTFISELCFAVTVIVCARCARCARCNENFLFCWLAVASILWVGVQFSHHLVRLFLAWNCRIQQRGHWNDQWKWISRCRPLTPSYQKFIFKTTSLRVT